MKMKLAISVALSHHSKLLILDEATSGLDPVIRDVQRVKLRRSALEDAVLLHQLVLGLGKDHFPLMDEYDIVRNLLQ